MVKIFHPSLLKRLGLLCVIPLLALTTILHAQSGALFVGSTPRTVSSLPQSLSGSGGLGFDFDRNYYFLDSLKQKVIKRWSYRAETTILDGLSNAAITVDWNGDLAVADYGHRRILFQEREASQPRQFAVPLSRAPKSIVIGKEKRIFYLAGSTLYSLSPVAGLSSFLADVPGAVLLANGPDTSQGHTLYVLSYQNNSYQAKIYTYSKSGGSLSASSLPVPVQGTVTSFQVDPSGNYLCRVENGSIPAIVLVSKAGDSYELGYSDGANAGVAMDRLSRFAYVDGTTVKEIQFGTVDLGSYYAYIYNEYIGGWYLRYAEPPGSHAFARLRFSSYGSFFLSQSQYNGSGSAYCSKVDPGSLCAVYVSMVAQSLGILRGSVNINSNSISTPIVGTATDSNLYPIQENATITDIPVGVNHPSYVAINPETGSWNVAEAAGNLENINGMARDISDTVYITRKNIPGVLRVWSSGESAQIGAEIDHPVGVAVDRQKNIYVGSESGAIYKIWAADDSVSYFASPGKQVSARGISSLAADKPGNIYVAYTEGGSSGNGALFRLGPGGGSTELNAQYTQIAGLALDLGGALYFSDAGSKTLQLLTTSGHQYTLLSELNSPVAVAATDNGLFAVADPAAGVLRRPAPPAAGWGYDFGDVPLGTTKSGYRLVLNSGNSGESAWLVNGGDDGLDYESSPYLEPGDAGPIRYTFTPQHLGQALIKAGVFYTQGHSPQDDAVIKGNGVAP